MMGAYNEAMGDAGIPPGLALLIALGVAAALAVGLLRVIREAFRYPPMWPLLAGAGAFWWFLLTGRVWWGAGALFAGMGATIAMQSVPRWAPKASPKVGDGRGGGDASPSR